MIFQLNKNKSDLARSVESDTIARWREMAGSKAPVVGETSAAAEEPTQQPEFTADPTPEPIAPRWTVESGTLGQGSVEKISDQSSDSHSAMPVPTAELPKPAPARTPIPSSRTSSSVSGEIHSALGPGTVIEGKLRFDSPVRIDGSLIGEVTSTSVLVVGEQAVVKAIVNVGTLVVHGQVTGQVEAKEKVEIKDGGSLEANIRTRNLVIDEGGYFRGGCNTN